MSENDGKVSKLADCLLRVEAHMRMIGEWSPVPPSDEALASTEPFCVDTLMFTEWLQFVFLVRMKELVERDAPLPSVSGIAPMAEEHFRSRSQPVARLIAELAVIDELLSDS